MEQRIPLTKTQKAVAEWALAGVRDKAAEDNRAYRSCIDAGGLLLRDQEDTDDLLYRLEEQLQDMAEFERPFPEGPKAAGEARAALNLARKIRAARGEGDE